MAVVAAMEHQPGCLADLEGDLRRDRAVRPAANAVGAEILADHRTP